MYNFIHVILFMNVKNIKKILNKLENCYCACLKKLRMLMWVMLVTTNLFLSKWYHLIDVQINIQNMILPHVK